MEPFSLSLSLIPYIYSSPSSDRRRKRKIIKHETTFSNVSRLTIEFSLKREERKETFKFRGDSGKEYIARIHSFKSQGVAAHETRRLVASFLGGRGKESGGDLLEEIGCKLRERAKE